MSEQDQDTVKVLFQYLSGGIMENNAQHQGRWPTCPKHRERVLTTN